MKTDRAVIEFLAQPKNLRLALEVADAMEDLRTHVEDKFLTPIMSELAGKLAKSRFAADWELERGVEQPALSRSRYVGLWFYPKAPSSPRVLFFPLVIAYEGTHRYLYYGIEWDGEDGLAPKGFPTPASLPLMKFLDGPDFGRNKKTPGWKTLAEFDSEKELVLCLTEQADELSREAISGFWAFFEQTADMVRAANVSLAKLKG